MSGAHSVENTDNEKIEKPNISNPTASTPPNNEELLKLVGDLADRIQKLDDKLEDLEPFIKISRFIGHWFGNPSNDTQENPKDALKKEEALKKFQEKHTKPTENTELVEENKALTTEKENLTNQLNASQKQMKELEQSQQVLKNEKAELLREKDNLAKENTCLLAARDRLTEEKRGLTTEKKASQKNRRARKQKRHID